MLILISLVKLQEHYLWNEVISNGFCRSGGSNKGSWHPHPTHDSPPPSGSDVPHLKRMIFPSAVPLTAYVKYVEIHFFINKCSSFEPRSWWHGNQNTPACDCDKPAWLVLHWWNHKFWALWKLLCMNLHVMKCMIFIDNLNWYISWRHDIFMGMECYERPGYIYKYIIMSKSRLLILSQFLLYCSLNLLSSLQCHVIYVRFLLMK